MVEYLYEYLSFAGAWFETDMVESSRDITIPSQNPDSVAGLPRTGTSLFIGHQGSQDVMQHSL